MSSQSLLDRLVVITPPVIDQLTVPKVTVAPLFHEIAVTTPVVLRVIVPIVLLPPLPAPVWGRMSPLDHQVARV